MALYDYYKSMEQIAAGLAHEAKNPLSLVKANIDFLESEDSQKIHAKNYKIMRREIDKINNLLLDFIQFAKPLENNLEKINLVQILEELIDDIHLSYNKQLNITLDNQCVDQIFVLCDKSKMTRVFLNVVKNAVEAIDDDGTIKITVSNQKNYFKIVIADNGKGLKKHDIDKISSPFYTTKQGGSGLGLFISKTIVHEHQGFFEITGEENKGCQVMIMLPSLT